MSNNYWDEEEDDELDTEIETSNDGSDLLKKLRKAKRADEKRIKELEEKVNSFSKVERERTVKEVLEKQGVNPKAARLALKDLEADVTAEAVMNWLEDNGDLFGYQPQQDAPSANEEERRALAAQDSLTAGAATPDRADAVDGFDKFTSEEDFVNYLRSQS